MTAEEKKIILDLLGEVRNDQKINSERLLESKKAHAKHEAFLDAMREDIVEIKSEVKVNTMDLKEHMRRTDLLEAAQKNAVQLHEFNREKILHTEKMVEEQAKKISKLEFPIKARAWFLNSTIWIISTIGLVIGLVTKILQIW